jgi:hypothetical protein
MKQSAVITLCVLGAVMAVVEMHGVKIDSQLASITSGKRSKRIFVNFDVWQPAIFCK